MKTYTIAFKNANDYIDAADALSSENIHFTGGNGLTADIAKTDWDDALEILKEKQIPFTER